MDFKSANIVMNWSFSEQKFFTILVIQLFHNHSSFITMHLLPVETEMDIRNRCNKITALSQHWPMLESFGRKAKVEKDLKNDLYWSQQVTQAFLNYEFLCFIIH